MSFDVTVEGASWTEVAQSFVLPLLGVYWDETNKSWGNLLQDLRYKNCWKLFYLKQKHTKLWVKWQTLYTYQWSPWGIKLSYLSLFICHFCFWSTSNSRPVHTNSLSLIYSTCLWHLFMTLHIPVLLCPFSPKFYVHIHANDIFHHLK